MSYGAHPARSFYLPQIEEEIAISQWTLLGMR